MQIGQSSVANGELCEAGIGKGCTKARQARSSLIAMTQVGRISRS